MITESALEECPLAWSQVVPSTVKKATTTRGTGGRYAGFWIEADAAEDAGDDMIQHNAGTDEKGLFQDYVHVGRDRSNIVTIMCAWVLRQINIVDHER